MPEIQLYPNPALKFETVTTNATPVEMGRYTINNTNIGTITVEVWGVARGGSRDTIHTVKEVDFKKIGGTLTILRNIDIVAVDAKGTIAAATVSLVKVGDAGGVVNVTGVAAVTIDWFCNFELRILR